MGTSASRRHFVHGPRSKTANVGRHRNCHFPMAFAVHTPPKLWTMRSLFALVLIVSKCTLLLLHEALSLSLIGLSLIAWKGILLCILFGMSSPTARKVFIKCNKVVLKPRSSCGSPVQLQSPVDFGQYGECAPVTPLSKPSLDLPTTPGAPFFTPRGSASPVTPTGRASYPGLCERVQVLESSVVSVLERLGDYDVDFEYLAQKRRQRELAIGYDCPRAKVWPWLVSLWKASNACLPDHWGCGAKVILRFQRKREARKAEQLIRAKLNTAPGDITVSPNLSLGEKEKLLVLDKLAIQFALHLPLPAPVVCKSHIRLLHRGTEIAWFIRKEGEQELCVCEELQPFV